MPLKPMSATWKRAHELGQPFTLIVIGVSNSGSRFSLGNLNLGGDEVHLTTGPLYHSGPLAFAVLTHFVAGTVVVMRKFDAEEWVRLVTRHRVNSTFSAPTQLKRIVSLPPEVLHAGDYSSLRTLIANAAPVPYALKKEVVEKLGEGFLYEVYGSTELGVDTILRPEDQHSRTIR